MRVRALVLFVVAAMLAAPVARADTKSDLAAAKKRMSALQKQIVSQESRIDSLKAQQEDAARELDDDQAVLAKLRGRQRGLERQAEQTLEQLVAQRRQIAERARAVYKHGPVPWFSLLLDAPSLTEFSERATFVGRMVRHDTDIALAVQRTEAQYRAQAREQEQLADKQVEVVRESKAQTRKMTSLVAEQQAQLSSLAKARGELTSLITRLGDQLTAEQRAAAVKVAGRGMPISFGAWADAFLRTLGAPVSRNNLVAVVAWETAEYTKATWNPLATTWSMPGATVYNSHGVRNYISKEQGIEATIKTLSRPNHGYEAIVSNLRASADPMETGRAINASDWCRGCTGGQYVIKLIPAVQQYYERYAG